MLKIAINPETLLPVNLYVKPELKHTIELYHDNEKQDRKEFSVSSKRAGHGVFQIMSGTLHHVTQEYYLINKRFVSNLLVMNQLKIVNGLLQDILTYITKRCG